jgi:hypothetical protein
MSYRYKLGEKASTNSILLLSLVSFDRYYYIWYLPSSILYGISIRACKEGYSGRGH